MIFWGILLLILLIAAVFALGWKLSDFALNPTPFDPEETRKEELARCGVSEEEYQSWPKEEFSLHSRYGYRLCGTVLPAPSPQPAGPARVVVMVHGHGTNRDAELSYAVLFRSLGYITVLYDHRNFGQSDRRPTTMGKCEAEDLETVCGWVRQRYGADCILGTHGVSMGGATVMLHSAMDSHLAFVVEDCGYSDLTAQLAFVMRTVYHLPPRLFLPLCYPVAWLRTGVWFPAIHPAEAVAKSEMPMLFIHGAQDTYVPFWMLQANYDAKTKGIKKMQVFEQAAHAMSYASDPALYRRTITEFLREIGQL